jgi:diacylglycerol O-acyltransferase
VTERMHPLDAFFVFTETNGATHMHVGGFATVQGRAPGLEDVLAHVAGKLPLIPRYRQVVHTVPLHLGRPVWADAQDFDLSRHVHRVRLPHPTREALRDFMADQISRRLDRTRPLWELWVVDGVGPDEWAVAWKIHHCMIDGVSGTELLTVLFDTSPEPAPPVEDHWRPGSAPSTPALLRDAVADLARTSLGTAASVARGAVRVRATTRQLAALASDGTRMGARMALPDLSTPLNGPVGPDRSYDWSTVSLADVKAIRTAFGGTVNDVVLTAVLAGYRDLLVGRGKPVAGRKLKIMVPVARRARDAHGRPVGDGTMTTNASGLVADLPLDVDDPVQRLSAVRTRLDHLKASGESDAMHAINEISGVLPAVVVAAGVRALGTVAQRSIGTVVTNVPGPSQVLYLLGGRIEHIWNYAPPFPVGARTSVSIYSYQGDLHVGVTGDRRTVPDVDVIAAGIRQGVADLLAAATGAAGR